MRRTVHIAVLALLLLFMQHRGYVHPFAHVVARTSAPQETVLSVQYAAADCLECDLLASGTHAAFDGVPVVALAAPPAFQPTVSYRSRAAEVSAWFDSRAPPILL